MRIYKDHARGPFFGANRPGAKVSRGRMDSFWLQGMQASHKNTCDCMTDTHKDKLNADLLSFLLNADLLSLLLNADLLSFLKTGDSRLQNARCKGSARAACNDFTSLTAHPKRRQSALTSVDGGG